MAMRSTSASSTRRNGTEVNKSDPTEFSGNVEATPLKTASSRSKKNEESAETRSSRNNGNADFLVSRSDYDRQTQTYRSN